MSEGSKTGEGRVSPSIDAVSVLVEELLARVARYDLETARLLHLRLDDQARELALATREALTLAKSLHAEHYFHVSQWEPLDDIRGLISQVDNMAAGLSVDLVEARARIAALEDAVRVKDEALRPFAAYGEYLDREWADHTDNVIVAGPIDSNMTFGDFRRARTALSNGEPHDR